MSKYEVTTVQTIYLTYYVEGSSSDEAKATVGTWCRESETNPARFVFAGREDGPEVWEPLNGDDEWVLDVRESEIEW